MQGKIRVFFKKHAHRWHVKVPKGYLWKSRIPLHYRSLSPLGSIDGGSLGLSIHVEELKKRRFPLPVNFKKRENWLTLPLDHVTIPQPVLVITTYYTMKKLHYPKLLISFSCTTHTHTYTHTHERAWGSKPARDLYNKPSCYANATKAPSIALPAGSTSR